MRLSIGAGRFEHDDLDWIRLDAAASTAPDVRALATELPFDAASIECIDAIDVLEHISYHDTAAALAEWRRVLEAGGELYVQVPDLDLLIEWYLRAPHKLVGWNPPPWARDPLGALTWKLLGGQSDGRYVTDAEWRYNAHYALFTRASLTEALQVAGFQVGKIIVNEHPNICCWARRAA